jgi:hypothetical protein
MYDTRSGQAKASAGFVQQQERNQATCVSNERLPLTWSNRGASLEQNRTHLAMQERC